MLRSSVLGSAALLFGCATTCNARWSDLVAPAVATQSAAAKQLVAKVREAAQS